MIQLHVLHIMPGFGGGISSHVRNIIRGIDKEKVVIDVASFTDYPSDFIDEVEAKGGQTFHLKNVRVKTLISCIGEYVSILKANKYDVIHLHLTDFQAAYFSILSRLCGVHRVIVHAHIADQPNTNNPLVKVKYECFKYLTKAVATEYASCSKAASVFRFGQKCVDQKKIMHIPNSIDVKKYESEITESEKASLKKELNINSNAMVFGNVGYFGYQKNHPFMLKLIDKMQKENLNFVWIFVGDGRDFELIQNQAREMGIFGSCRFLGRRNDVNRLLQLMDVSILPSHYEGLPTVAIESQAAGTPIVVSTAVTEEIDMGMGLVVRVGLDESLDVWVETIKKAVHIEVPTVEERIKKIDSLFFTAPSAAKLYTAFLEGQIKSYNLGEKIEL